MGPRVPILPSPPAQRPLSDLGPLQAFLSLLCVLSALCDLCVKPFRKGVTEVTEESDAMH